MRKRLAACTLAAAALFGGGVARAECVEGPAGPIGCVRASAFTEVGMGPLTLANVFAHLTLTGGQELYISGFGAADQTFQSHGHDICVVASPDDYQCTEGYGFHDSGTDFEGISLYGAYEDCVFIEDGAVFVCSVG